MVDYYSRRYVRQQGSVIFAALILVAAVGVLSTVLHYGNSLNNHLAYQPRSLTASVLAPTPTPLNLNTVTPTAGTASPESGFLEPCGMTGINCPGAKTAPTNSSTKSKTCKDINPQVQSQKQTPSSGETTGQTTDENGTYKKLLATCVAGCKYIMTTTGLNVTIKPDAPTDPEKPGQKCTVCFKGTCETQTPGSGGVGAPPTPQETANATELLKKAASAATPEDAAAITKQALESKEVTPEALQQVSDAQKTALEQQYGDPSSKDVIEKKYGNMLSIDEQIKAFGSSVPVPGTGGTPAPDTGTAPPAIVPNAPPGGLTPQPPPGGGTVAPPINPGRAAPGIGGPDSTFGGLGGLGGGGMTGGIMSFLSGMMRGVGGGGGGIGGILGSLLGGQGGCGNGYGGYPNNNYNTNAYNPNRGEFLGFDNQYDYYGDGNGNVIPYPRNNGAYGNYTPVAGGIPYNAGYGAQSGCGAQGGYGSGQGGYGGTPPVGNQTPQRSGTCNTQYLCSGQTLLYRNNQCVDQPMQRCQYGCNGNQCAQQNGQQQGQGQYGYGTDGQACMQPPTQPDPSTCTAGTWRPTSGTSNGCTTSWQCVPGNTQTGVPTASMSCQSQVADVGSTFGISYTCQNAVTSLGGGFDTQGQLSGQTSVIIGTPPAGTNTATYTLGCRNNAGLTVGAQCSVQINKPLIALTTNPTVVSSGGTSVVGWVTSGMSACVVSSPDNTTFTTQNATSTNANGVAVTPSLTATTRIQLTCTTFGGGTLATSTVVTVQ